jgi:phenylacetate-CoA ligase
LTIVGYTRSRVLEPAIRENSAFYLRPWTEQEQRQTQLSRLNEYWRGVLSDVPYYRQLLLTGQVPRQFMSLEEFVSKVPVVDKDKQRTHMTAMTAESRRPDFYGATAGTTASPARFPTWRSERRITGIDKWTGRAWYGVGPGSRLFLIWGHIHMLGSGPAARLQRHARAARDWALGYYRFPAYELSKRRLRLAGKALLEFRPDYVYSYSAAIDAFALANQDRAAEFSRLGLKDRKSVV